MSCNRTRPPLTFVLLSAMCLLLSLPAGRTLAALTSHDGRIYNLTPAAGRFLVATPAMRGNYFRETVVFITTHDQRGTTGVIVNRPTMLAASDLFPTRNPVPIYEGGPVLPTVASVLLASQHPITPLRPGGISYLFGTFHVLRLLAGSTPHGGEARIYFGYCGWAPGQLQSEIARGAWYVVEGDRSLVFDAQPDWLWARLLRRVHPFAAADAFLQLQADMPRPQALR